MQVDTHKHEAKVSEVFHIVRAPDSTSKPFRWRRLMMNTQMKSKETQIPVFHAEIKDMKSCLTVANVHLGTHTYIDKREHRQTHIMQMQNNYSFVWEKKAGLPFEDSDPQKIHWCYAG